MCGRRTKCQAVAPAKLLAQRTQSQASGGCREPCGSSRAWPVEVPAARGSRGHRRRSWPFPIRCRLSRKKPPASLKCVRNAVDERYGERFRRKIGIRPTGRLLVYARSAERRFPPTSVLGPLSTHWDISGFGRCSGQSQNSDDQFLGVSLDLIALMQQLGPYPALL